jgi:VanZ family protein
MVARSEAQHTTGGDRIASSWRNRLWRYVPLLCWIGLIFFASTGTMSASNTSRIIGPLFKWLFPDITATQLLSVHFTVRKLAHFTEYAILALLAARAFIPSTNRRLRHAWFMAAFSLVALIAFIDEYHQSFLATRTGTIWDSLIDITGGAIALVVFRLWRMRESHRRS